MDGNMLLDYVMEQCLVMLPVLWILGAVLKNTPHVPDWLIPYILTIFGVAGACCLVGFHVEGVIQGVLVTGCAVLGHQMCSQAQKKGTEGKQPPKEEETSQ